MENVVVGATREEDDGKILNFARFKNDSQRHGSVSFMTFCRSFRFASLQPAEHVALRSLFAPCLVRGNWLALLIVAPAYS